MNNPKSHFYQAFDATVKKFDLDVHEVSNASGISLSKLALFRGGFDTNVDTVESLIVALPVEARKYFMELVVNPDMLQQINRTGCALDGIPVGHCVLRTVTPVL